MSGYVVNHAGRSFTPHGALSIAMTDEQARAHNAALGRAEIAAIRATVPPRFVGYLSRETGQAPIITTWTGAQLATVTRWATGRRWSPFDGRWHQTVRGHSHVISESGAVACYTFSGDFGMLTRLRKVGACRAPKVQPAPEAVQP